jgi:hypothetical protein
MFGGTEKRIAFVVVFVATEDDYGLYAAASFGWGSSVHQHP